MVTERGLFILWDESERQRLPADEDGKTRRHRRRPQSRRYLHRGRLPGVHYLRMDLLDLPDGIRPIRLALVSYLPVMVKILLLDRDVSSTHRPTTPSHAAPFIAISAPGGFMALV